MSKLFCPQVKTTTNKKTRDTGGGVTMRQTHCCQFITCNCVMIKLHLVTLCLSLILSYVSVISTTLYTVISERQAEGQTHIPKTSRNTSLTLLHYKVNIITFMKDDLSLHGAAPNKVTLHSVHYTVDVWMKLSACERLVVLFLSLNIETYYKVCSTLHSFPNGS